MCFTCAVCFFGLFVCSLMHLIVSQFFSCFYLLFSYMFVCFLFCLSLVFVYLFVCLFLDLFLCCICLFVCLFYCIFVCHRLFFLMEGGTKQACEPQNYASWNYDQRLTGVKCRATSVPRRCGKVWQVCGLDFSNLLDLQFSVLLSLYQHCMQKLKIWRLILASPYHMNVIFFISIFFGQQNAL